MMRSIVAVTVATLAFAGCRDEVLTDLAGGIAGQVCNPVTGRPAGGATVTAKFIRENTGQEDTKEVTADETGFFRVGGLPVTAVDLLVVQADEFQNTIPAIAIEALEDVQLTDPACRDLPDEPGIGELVGQVCNRHTGEYVDEGTVTVLLPDGGELVAQITDDGSFVMPDVPAGVHIVYVQAPGFQKTYQIEVTEGAPTLLEDQVIDCRPYDPLTTGIIKGKVCGAEVAGEPGGPLAGARVFITDNIDGFVYEDETLPDGSFTIAGIPTPQADLIVRAEKGGFAFQWTGVDVFSIADNPDGTDLTAEVGCEPLVPDDGRRYLVVKGTFDHIENVLERMGLVYETVEGNPIDFSDRWTIEAFGNYDVLATYDAVFVNCGVAEADFLQFDAQVRANLRRYVEEGGSLYVSDWSYDLVEAVWPDRINFLADDTQNSAAEFGEDGTYAMAVTEPGLADYIGGADVDIEFKFGNFAIVSQIASGVTTYLRGTVNYRVNGAVSALPDTPLTVGFTEGIGRVIFTSFHQESNAAETCTTSDECSGGLSCTGGFCSEELLVDGPEDMVLRYIIFSL